MFYIQISKVSDFYLNTAETALLKTFTNTSLCIHVWGHVSDICCSGEAGRASQHPPLCFYGLRGLCPAGFWSETLWYKRERKQKTFRLSLLDRSHLGVLALHLLPGSYHTVGIAVETRRHVHRRASSTQHGDNWSTAEPRMNAQTLIILPVKRDVALISRPPQVVLTCLVLWRVLIKTQNLCVAGPALTRLLKDLLV